MPSLASLTGRFDMMSIVANNYDQLTVALAAPKTPVAKAMQPLAKQANDEGVGLALSRAMRIDGPDSNPLGYRTRVMAYTSGA